MITSLSGIARRFFLANKGLTFSSVLSVALSVFLVITMTIFSGNAQLSLEEEMRRMYGEMDIAVGYEYGSESVFDMQKIDRVKSVEGIEQASAVIIDRMYIDDLQASVDAIGVENDRLAKSRYHFHSDLGPKHVLINASFAEALQLNEGDTFRIEGRPYTISEVIPDSGLSGAGTDIVIMPREELKNIVLEQSSVLNEAAYVMLKVNHDADLTTIVQSIQQIDPQFQIDLADEHEFYTENLQLMRYFIYVLSGLALIVSAFFILSNAESIMYKYRNQLAIMRSLGASRSQVSKLLWLQLGLMNACGAVLGFLLALVSHRLTQNWISGLFSVTITEQTFQMNTALLLTAICFALIQLFMIFPVIRSMRIAPLKITAQNERIDFKQGRMSKWFGVLMLGVALFLIVIGRSKQLELGTGELYFLFAALFAVFGMMRLFSYYLKSILSFIAPIVKRIAGPISFVAIRNLIPQVRRNTFMILMISVLLMISMLGGALFKSIQYNENVFLEQQYETNVLVTSRTGLETTIDPLELTKTVKELTGIESVSSISRSVEAYMMHDGEWNSFHYRLGDLDSMMKQQLIERVDAGYEEGILITKEMAEQYGLDAGDRIELGRYSETLQTIVSVQTVTIAGVHDTLSHYYNDAYFDWSKTDWHTEYTVFDRLFVQADDVNAALSRLDQLSQLYPLQLKIASYDEALEQSNEMFIQRWALFIAVLAVIMISVMFGIINALMNNIQAKRKEYALLRTLSVTGSGITKVVMTQVILYVVLGIAFGIAAGGAATWIVGIIDFGNVYLDLKLTASVSLMLLMVCTVIFVPFAYSLRRRNLPLELTQDNK